MTGKLHHALAMVALGIGLGGGVFANAGGLLLDPVLARSGWEEIRFDDKIPNTFHSCGDGCIRVKTMNSVSMIGKRFPVRLQDRPVLSWEWMIDRPAPESNLFEKGQDDRAVAVYVTFPYNPETASFGEKMLRPIVEWAKGEDAPGRVISYVWGGNGRRGALQESPYFGSTGAIKIVRNHKDAPGIWMMERVNVLEDYRKIFGDVPAMVSHILISSDSDDVGIEGTASVRGIFFKPSS
ncbi:MAG: DUF3047 domain-containing protein [Alphaproteobacteria bacterium]|nr:DUF3047 domain-containing protein [Alphaproteobacteria bacterium]